MADTPMVYEFEWDPEKGRANQRKHGVPFEEAATVFLDPLAVSLYDEGHSEQEDRWISAWVFFDWTNSHGLPHIPANRRGAMPSADHHVSESHRAREEAVWQVRR